MHENDHKNTIESFHILKWCIDKSNALLCLPNEMSNSMTTMIDKMLCYVWYICAYSCRCISFVFETSTWLMRSNGVQEHMRACVRACWFIRGELINVTEIKHKIWIHLNNIINHIFGADGVRLCPTGANHSTTEHCNTVNTAHAIVKNNVKQNEIPLSLRTNFDGKFE